MPNYIAHTRLVEVKDAQHKTIAAVDAHERLLPWQERGLQYTASGYGAKIPTRWVVHYAGRTRRVYCTIYSNIGTCWILVNGERLYVD